MRADQKLNYPPPPKMEPDGMLTNGGDHHHHNLHQYAEKQQPQFRQLHLDYDMNSKENNSQNKAEPQQASRIPTGHMRRDRASLRAKQRKDMEQARMQVRIQWFKSKHFQKFDPILLLFRNKDKILAEMKMTMDLPKGHRHCPMGITRVKSQEMIHQLTSGTYMIACDL